MNIFDQCREYGVITIPTTPGREEVVDILSAREHKHQVYTGGLGQPIDARWVGSGLLVYFDNGHQAIFEDFNRYQMVV